MARSPRSTGRAVATQIEAELAGPVQAAPLPSPFAQRVPFVPIPTVIGIPSATKRNGEGGGGVLVFLSVVAMIGAAVYWFVLREQDNSPQTSSRTAATPTVVTGAPDANGDPTLPASTFERPAYTTATWSESWTDLVRRDGATQQQQGEVAGAADYSRGVVRTESRGDVAGGMQPQTLVITREHSFEPGTAFGAPWTRRPLPSGSARLDPDAPHLRLYQDVVTDDVRATAWSVLITSEVLSGTPVTSYRFDHQIPKPAPIDPGTPLDPDLPWQSVRVSIDADGMVRLYEQHVSEDSIPLLAPGVAEGSSIRLSTRIEVTSLSDAPVDVQLPPNFVDG